MLYEIVVLQWWKTQQISHNFGTLRIIKRMDHADASLNKKKKQQKIPMNDSRLVRVKYAIAIVL